MMQEWNQKQAHTCPASSSMNSGMVYRANTSRHSSSATAWASQRRATGFVGGGRSFIVHMSGLAALRCASGWIVMGRGVGEKRGGGGWAQSRGRDVARQADSATLRAMGLSLIGRFTSAANRPRPMEMNQTMSYLPVTSYR